MKSKFNVMQVNRLSVCSDDVHNKLLWHNSAHFIYIPVFMNQPWFSNVSNNSKASTHFVVKVYVGTRNTVGKPDFQHLINTDKWSNISCHPIIAQTTPRIVWGHCENHVKLTMRDVKHFVSIMCLWSRTSTAELYISLTLKALFSWNSSKEYLLCFTPENQQI